MKQSGFWKCATLISLGVVAAVWAAAQVSVAPQSLSKWMPGGALLYLESSDFSTQLGDWSRSGVKARWLASKNHEQFMTTRLVLKLEDVYTEFANAAGFAPDLDQLATVSGTDTALALYDIGRLDLVYVSRLPSAQLGQNVLTRVRAGYQARNAAGIAYFVRQAGDRTAAFAIAGEYVVVSTREDLLAATLERIQGSTAGQSISEEAWYEDAFRGLSDDAAGPVALRLVMDLPNVIKTPYFRSYWIQKNTADLGRYSAFLSQIRRNAEAVEESRVLIRSEEGQIVAHESAMAELQRFVPDGVGLFRLWDTSSTDFALNMIQQKFFSPGPSRLIVTPNAPSAGSEGLAGSEGDLQTRIDEAPKPSLKGSLMLDRLRTLIEAAGLQAMLHLEATLPEPGATFVGTDAALALRASSPWNAAEVRTALTSAVDSYQSVGGIGLQWRNLASGSYTFSQWDGLIPLTIYVDGQTLWIARTPALLASALNRPATAAAAQTGTYLARYNHRTELAPYLKMMGMLDLSDQRNYSSFFSENIGSLAAALDAIQSVSVKTSESGPVQRQTVRYELGSSRLR